MFAVLLTAASCGADASVINNTFINSALGIIKAKHIAAMITIISNVLPSVIGAVANTDDTKKDDDEAPQPEQPDTEKDHGQEEAPTNS